MAVHKRFYNSQDAIFQDQDVIIGMAEEVNLRGRGRPMEDALIAFTLDGFKRLSVSQREQLLKETLAQMQESYGQVEKGGSTACGVIAWRENGILTLNTANVGDSTAFLVTINPPNEVNIKRLNYLHNPDSKNSNVEPAELERVSAVIGSRPKGHLHLGLLGLAVSRAIGDVAFESVGLSHDADVSSQTIPLSSTEKAFILVTCDGLTEGGCLLDKEIAEMVASHSAESPNEIAEFLIKAARIGNDVLNRYCSKDDISVACFEVKSPRPHGAFVFDGHGECFVSNELGNHFFTYLSDNLTKALTQS